LNSRNQFYMNRIKERLSILKPVNLSGHCDYLDKNRAILNFMKIIFRIL
jgi:hypothetical protein